MREYVTILHPGPPGGVDDYGEPLPTPMVPEEVLALGVAPGPSEENNRNQETVEIQWTVYLPTGTEVAHNDRMIVRGRTYEVDQHPADWISPFSTWAPGIVVALIEAS